jgi:hypothetical protein
MKILFLDLKFINLILNLFFLSLKNIKMNKSKSYPVFTDDFQDIPPIKKTTSLDELKLDDFYFEEFFEGDGPLGIVFAKDHKNNIIVKNILENTVASETYGLYKSMILIDIDNNSDITKKSLISIEKLIQQKWTQTSRIYLKFKKHIYQEVYTKLLDNNLSKYYDQFVELGASSLSDFDFVEYDDLIKMNMNKSDIISFRNINHNI